MLDYKIKAKTQGVLGFSVRPQILVLCLSVTNCDFWQVTQPVFWSPYLYKQMDEFLSYQVFLELELELLIYNSE